jgi:hypothetical protein
MFNSAQITDYYRIVALEHVKRELEETSDADALGRNTDEWTRYLIEKHSLQLVEVDPDRPLEGREIVANGYPAVRIFQPMVPSETLSVIAEHGLAGQGPWLDFDYTTFFDARFPNSIGQTVAINAAAASNAKRQIEDYIRSLNAAIEHENARFRQQVHQLVVSKQSSVTSRHSQLDDLSAKAGIPIIKRADVSTVIPTVVRVREKIAPLIPPTAKRQERPVLERDRFNAIVELIDNQCRQFERTPSAFQLLGEEHLRDIMLSSLNAVFEGAAGGELFRGIGKVDIHLQISQGEVFIDELKVWDGPRSLAEVVQQLRERLTWRDAFGVATIFSKNAGFSAVLEAIEAALPGLPGFVPGTFKKVEANVFVARFSLPGDTARHIEIQVRAYDLHVARAAGRT